MAGATGAVSGPVSGRFSGRLVPIAEDLYDVPSESQITCELARTALARLILENGEVGVTMGGYVGRADVGLGIHHTLSGSHHALALGEGRVSAQEPEAGETHASVAA